MNNLKKLKSNLEINVLDKFKPLFKEDFNIAILYSGRNSGKTYTSVLYCLLYALRHRNEYGTIVLGRAYQRHIRYSLLTEAKKILNKYKEISSYFNIGADSLACGNIEFIFVGLNINYMNIKGLSNVMICLIDEADQLTLEAITTLLPTIREDKSKTIFCFNPTSKLTPFSQWFLKRCNKLYTTYIENKRLFIFSNYKDNKYLSNKSKEEIEKDKIDMSEEEFDNIYNGKYSEIARDGLLVNELNTMRINRYLDIEVNPYKPIYAVWDLGINDLTVCWIFQYYDQYYRFIDVIYGNNEVISYWINTVISKYNINTHFLPEDSKRRSYTNLNTVADEFRKYNQHISIFHAEENFTRLQKTRSLFTTFMFDPKCEEGLYWLGKLRMKIVNGTPTDSIAHDGKVKDFYDPISVIYCLGIKEDIYKIQDKPTNEYYKDSWDF